MASAVKFNDFIRALGVGEHDLNGDDVKVFLTNTAPVAGTHTKKGSGGGAELDGITEENGYAPTSIDNEYSQTGGVGTMTSKDSVVFTASGGTIGPFRYVVLYNDDHVTDGLICYYDYASSITLQIGESFTVDFGVSILTLSVV